MRFSTLSRWLSWIVSVHGTEIELGLDRVKEVAARLRVLSLPCSIIVVGGTNGKGSTVAGLEAIYDAAGYHVGAFTSPILFKHNEQVRIDRKPVSDEQFCLAFERIERMRGDISLTPFEFYTLAALVIFQQYPLDVLILEVGLGGRLDAVNIMDADVAVITSIDLDHTDRLGATREKIAYEKAGIFRHNSPAICGDFNPPDILMECAERLNAPFFCQGKDFFYEEDVGTWSWSYKTTMHHLPLNTLMLQNMSSALMAISLLQDRFPVSRNSIDRGLLQADLPGRVQVLFGPITEIYDVSHNPAAVALLAKRLQEIPCFGKTYAVFSMLADKDIGGSVRCIYKLIDTWYVAPLSVKRAAEKEMLLNAFPQTEEAILFSSIEEAYQEARFQAQLGDRIIIFGSFHTVADVWRCREKNHPDRASVEHLLR